MLQTMTVSGQVPAGASHAFVLPGSAQDNADVKLLSATGGYLVAKVYRKDFLGDPVQIAAPIDNSSPLPVTWSIGLSNACAVMVELSAGKDAPVEYALEIVFGDD